jgi:hypothetical protein
MGARWCEGWGARGRIVDDGCEAVMACIAARGGVGAV